jgi:hypothetical protein
VLRFVRLRSTPPNAGASAPPPSSTSLAQCMRMSAAQIRAAPPFARTSARRWRRSDVPGTYRARDIRQEQPAPIARTGRSSPEVLKQAWLAGVPISTVAAPSNQSQTIIVPLACAPVCPDLNRAPTPDTYAAATVCRECSVRRVWPRTLTLALARCCEHIMQTGLHDTILHDLLELGGWCFSTSSCVRPETVKSTPLDSRTLGERQCDARPRS